ncbi:Flp family type IVb pilin [Spongisporangium articulatum]|uniref:Flp family type IVb pilin n=1 Tax=Spongisporangium articulatum TaxID=3362603 RepID=A0ABW8ASW9_9ACTN
MLTKLRSTVQGAKDRGASAVEYGLMVAAIAAVIVAIVFGLGNLVGNTLDDTCQSITGQGVAGAGNGCEAVVPNGG